MLNRRLHRYAFLVLLVAFTSSTGALSQGSVELTEPLSGLSRSLESLAQRVGQATVQIFSLKYAPPSGPVTSASGVLSEERATGSGTLVSPDGYIVTNAHLVSNARIIQVVLATPLEDTGEVRSILKPARARLTAEILGTDAETDLAVLKIAEESLPFLEFGNSDELRQGQLVMAFGSPLGLQNSVSLGVVSSVARQLRPDDRMIFIQTDAAINPGNSGGPLVDMTGKLVGVNTLILSQSGGNEGLGFSAPSNIVRHVYHQIRENGRVRRGWLGIGVQSVNPALAEGLGLSQSWGVVIANVSPTGPASLAGFKVGDVILTLDGKVMENARQLEVNVYTRSPGDTIWMNLQRGSEQVLVRSAVIERDDGMEKFVAMVTRDRNLIPQLGILGVEVAGDVAKLLPPPSKLGGVVVAALAVDAGLRPDGLLPGDVIYEINGHSFSGLSGLKESIDRIKSGDAVVIQVQRLGVLHYVAFRME